MNYLDPTRFGLRLEMRNALYRQNIKNKLKKVKNII